MTNGFSLFSVAPSHQYVYCLSPSSLIEVLLDYVNFENWHLEAERIPDSDDLSVDKKRGAKCWHPAFI